MKRPKRAKPMSLEQLEVWFDKAEPEPPCNGVSMLNGFLTGLAVGPVFLLPNDWMFHVIGEHEKRAFIGTRTQAVIDTIVDHYNLVAHQLTTPGRYAPVLMRTDEDDVFADHWADGFLGAITLNPQEWEPLLAEKQTGEPLMSLLIQSTRPELAEMISMAFPKPSPDLLRDARHAIPFAVEQIYAHCKPMRYSPAAPANDP